RRIAAGVLRDEDGILIRGVAVAIDLAEGLRVRVAAGAHADLERDSALRGEERRDGPSAEHAAQDALLRLEERRSVEQRRVEDEFVVEALRAVSGVQIPGIDDGRGTTALVHDAGSQRASPGEVGTAGQAVPILCSEG